jgi:hypothetical protein
MSLDRIEDSARCDRAEARLKEFLDCVAYLLARRWLRETRKAERASPPPIQRSSGENQNSVVNGQTSANQSAVS